MHRSVTASKKWKVSLWILVLLSISARNAVGRKCVCTSKACKEAGVDVCRTPFSCYTEHIHGIDGTSRDNSTTRGCTEGATPLLCESNAWTRSSRRVSKLISPDRITNELNVVSSSSKHDELVWPSLKCCDTHDYCNSIVTDRAKNNDEHAEQSLVKSADDESIRESNVTRKNQKKSPDESESSMMNERERIETRTIAPKERESTYDPIGHRIRPLHIAVVVLAIAALTSVLGACYVITRGPMTLVYAPSQAAIPYKATLWNKA